MSFPTPGCSIDKQFIVEIKSALSPAVVQRIFFSLIGQGTFKAVVNSDRGSLIMEVYGI